MNNKDVYKPTEEDCRDDSRMALYSKTGGPTKAEVEESNRQRESKKELPPMLYDNLTEQADKNGQKLTVLDVEVLMAEKAYIRYRDSLVNRMAALGELYLLKKERLGHGNFLNWIRSRELLTVNEVTYCMKVAVTFPHGVNSNSYPGMNLSKKTILEIIYAPDEVKAEVKERLEAGQPVTRKEVVELKREHKKILEPPKPAKKEEVKGHSLPGGGRVDDVIDGEYTVDQPESPAEQPEEEYSELDALHDRINDLLRENQALESENKRLRLVVESDENLIELNKKFKELEAINAGLQSSLDGKMNENAAMREQLNKLEWRCKKLDKQVKSGCDKKTVEVDNEMVEMPDPPPLLDYFNDLDPENFNE